MTSTSLACVSDWWLDKSDIVSEAVVPLMVMSSERDPEPPCWNSQFNECVRSPSTPARSRTALEFRHTRVDNIENRGAKKSNYFHRFTLRQTHPSLENLSTPSRANWFQEYVTGPRRGGNQTAPAKWRSCWRSYASLISSCTFRWPTCWLGEAQHKIIDVRFLSNTRHTQTNRKRR